jgi:hypothetical protein
MVMKKVRHYLNNFSKGELTPSLWGHGDLAGYYEAVSHAENVWVTSSGSMAKRYGLVKIREYGGENYVKILGMAVVSGQRYLVVLREGAIDIVSPVDGTLIATLGVPDFMGERLPDIYYAAYQDSIIFTHHDIPPKHLKWTGGNNFTIGDIAFKNIPHFEYTANDIMPNGTCTPSGQSGFIGLGSSVDVFVGSDVGKYVSMLPIGRLRIDRVDGPRNVRGYLEEALFDGSVIAGGDWTLERGWEGLWGGTSGYPAVCGFHDGRLVLGNFKRVSTVFSYSVINSPFDFSLGDGTTAYGGWRILSYDQKNGICHMVSQHSLYFFCEYGEYVVDQTSGDSLGKAPILHDTSMGTTKNVRPAIGEDGSVYFFQRNSTALSQFMFSFESNGYHSVPISKYGGHLIYLPCSSAMWKGDNIFGTNILFYVNSDGTMVACTVNTNEKIVAFTRVIAGERGREVETFSEVCTCADQVFASVRGASGTKLMKFLSGNYGDDGNVYESKVVMLPISDPKSSYSGERMTVTTVHAYISNTSCLKIGNNIVYSGEPVTKKVTHNFPSGWDSDGMIELSDDAGGTFWQVNNVGRRALVG